MTRRVDFENRPTNSRTVAVVAAVLVCVVGSILYFNTASRDDTERNSVAAGDGSAADVAGANGAVDPTTVVPSTTNSATSTRVAIDDSESSGLRQDGRSPNAATGPIDTADAIGRLRVELAPDSLAPGAWRVRLVASATQRVHESDWLSSETAGADFDLPMGRFVAEASGATWSTASTLVEVTDVPTTIVLVRRGNATVRGRCVDEQGRPLANLTIALRARSGAESLHLVGPRPLNGGPLSGGSLSGGSLNGERPGATLTEGNSAAARTNTGAATNSANDRAREDARLSRLADGTESSVDAAALAPVSLATTDALGLFMFPTIPEGAHDLAIGSASTAFLPTRPVVIEAPHTDLGDVVVSAIAALEVHVHNSLGEPVSGARVVVAGHPQGQFEGVSDANGRVIVDALPHIEGRVFAHLEDVGRGNQPFAHDPSAPTPVVVRLLRRGDAPQRPR